LNLICIKRNKQLHIPFSLKGLEIFNLPGLYLWFRSCVCEW